MPTIKVVEVLRFFVREGVQSAGAASYRRARLRLHPAPSLDGWSAAAVLRRVQVALVRMVRAGPEAAPWTWWSIAARSGPSAAAS